MFPCTSAAFTLSAVSMGFVMRCQLARRPGLLCSFCPSPRTFALRLPPDKPSRACPCLRLVVIINPSWTHVATPTGDFHPITSRPCWAHTIRSTGRPASSASLACRFPSPFGLRSPVTSNVSTHYSSAMDDQKLIDAVNRSGFPLQIKTAALVEQFVERHGWRVRYSEHSWRSANDDGFIDLVLEDRHGTGVLVVECKRVLNASWVFLVRVFVKECG